jgi:hypothetical protein
VALSSSRLGSRDSSISPSSSRDVSAGWAEVVKQRFKFQQPSDNPRNMRCRKRRGFRASFTEKKRSTPEIKLQFSYQKRSNSEINYRYFWRETKTVAPSVLRPFHTHALSVLYIRTFANKHRRIVNSNSTFIWEPVN